MLPHSERVQGQTLRTQTPYKGQTEQINGLDENARCTFPTKASPVTNSRGHHILHSAISPRNVPTAPLSATKAKLRLETASFSRLAESKSNSSYLPSRNGTAASAHPNSAQGFVKNSQHFVTKRHAGPAIAGEEYPWQNRGSASWRAAGLEGPWDEIALKSFLQLNLQIASAGSRFLRPVREIWLRRSPTTVIKSC